jgi:hypothetical protein
MMTVAESAQAMVVELGRSRFRVMALNCLFRAKARQSGKDDGKSGSGISVDIIAFSITLSAGRSP